LIGLYRRIWDVTKSQQLLLACLSILFAVLAVVPLFFQKEIVNGLSTGLAVSSLFQLCFTYMGVLLLSGALKFALDYKSSLLGETIILEIREQIVKEQIVDGRVPDSEKLQHGSLLTMMTAEAEEVGKFVGAALTAPLIQIATLLSVIAFIAYNQPYLAVFAAAIVVPQALIVLCVQRKINEKIAERVKVLRLGVERLISEDVAQVEKMVLADFDKVFRCRERIFRLKFSSKFLLGALSNVGIVGTLLFGGLLVINGQTDIGTVVAALSGMRQIAQPWRDLVTFYRNLSSVVVKYQLLLPAIPIRDKESLQVR
jgi:ABC-type multidrug transport system fused ATPase/permease subunit